MIYLSKAAHTSPTAVNRRVDNSQWQFIHRNNARTFIKANISALEPYLGQAGWLTLSLFSIDSLGQQEDYLIHTLITDSGEILSEDLAQRLLTLPVTECIDILEAIPPSLEPETLKQQKKIQHQISERNANFFEKETTKLDHWADDLKIGLESEIKDIDMAIRDTRRASSLASTLEDKVVAQKQLKNNSKN